MKRIKKRRKNFRISNPLGFSLFCAMCILAVGLVVGIVCLAIGYGEEAIAYLKAQLNGTPVSAQASEVPTTAPTDAPSATASLIETPEIGTPVPETPTPEPIETPSVIETAAADAKQDPNAPLYGFTVGLDPTRDGGTKYKDECAYNLAFAEQLKSYLEAKGATVVLTREDNTTKNLDNSDRAKIIKNAECDIALRLMCNHIEAKNSGCYVQNTKKNAAYAKALITAYNSATGIRLQAGKTGGVETKNDTMAANCGCPCVLLIMGNWENKGDRTSLEDDAFRETMIRAIYDTLLDQLKN